MTRPQPERPERTEIPRRVTLSRLQRDRVSAAAAALEAHAGHGEDPLAMLVAAAELRRIVGAWDAASGATSDESVQPRLREALQRIASAESGVWGRIAQDALDDRKPLAVAATRGPGPQARR